ncbi:Flp pilus assembly protein CpaB [candidate division CSSED10-310 bacterium]|uniref:Flp pilus assembly protein CpaB n=1 Tax=candidate division CSSED10-310 bacterium TaxID=2855610 RepID=A0ABV6YXQ6_UNCC1
MKQRGILILALVLGIAAIILVQMYVKKVETKYSRDYDFVTVLVAKQNIAAGTTLENVMIDEKKVPKEYLSANAVTPKDRELILGQTVSIGLQQDQQISWSDLGVREAEGLSGIIKEGERAITIPVDDVSGVAGLLSPNDHVDIIGTFRTPTEMKRKVNVKSGDFTQTAKYDATTATVALLQNVTILAVGTQLGGYLTDDSMAMPSAQGNKGRFNLDTARSGLRRPTERTYKTVTLLVTPLEAQILVYASEKGDLTLSLRNPEDLLTEEETQKITFTDIVKPEFIRRTQIQRDERIRIYRGKDKKH